MAFVDYDAMKECGNLERTKLSDLFQTLNITDYTLTSNGRSICYDAIIHKRDEETGFIKSNIYVEVKVRRIPHNKYPDYLMQKDKFDNIHNKFTNPDDRMLYINFFSDNTVILFNINKRNHLYLTDSADENYCFYKRRLPMYTTGSRIFVEKEVTMLRFDESIDLLIKGELQ